MAIIDPTVVKQMVETALFTVSTSIVAAGNVYVQGGGMTRGDGLTRWVELVAIDLKSSPRPRGGGLGGGGSDEPDYAEIIVTVNCFCSRSQMMTNAHSLASVMAEVSRVLSQATLRETSSGPHQIDFDEVQTTPDAPDEQRHMASGVVIAMGTVMRVSGTTMAGLVS